MVGTRTWIAIDLSCNWSTPETNDGAGAPIPRPRTSTVVLDVGRGMAEQVRPDDLDGLLGDGAGHDPKGPELRLARIAGGHQHVVRVRLHRIGDIGPRRVRLGRGVRVVDDDRHLLPLV